MSNDNSGAADQPGRLSPDAVLYRNAAANMEDLARLGDSGSDEFQAAWGQLETVKARHGGMPPVGGAL